VRLARSDADPRFRSITEAFQISPNALHARVIRRKTAQVYSTRLSLQIARFLQLPQIFQHHRQIGLPGGDGGVSELAKIALET